MCEEKLGWKNNMLTNCFCLSLRLVLHWLWLIFSLKKKKTLKNFILCSSEEELKSFTAFHKPFVFLITLLALSGRTTLSSLGNLPTQKTFHNYLASYHGYCCLQHCLYEDYFTTIQPYNKEYHPIFRWICLVSGIIACELLVAILIFLFWLFIINLCTILVEEILRLWYQQIYEYLYATANVGFNPVCGLFQHIYQIICEIQDWFRRIFQSIQFV